MQSKPKSIKNYNVVYNKSISRPGTSSERLLEQRTRVLMQYRDGCPTNQGRSAMAEPVAGKSSSAVVHVDLGPKSANRFNERLPVHEVPTCGVQ